jgi:hypothetical protein
MGPVILTGPFQSAPSLAKGPHHILLADLTGKFDPDQRLTSQFEEVAFIDSLRKAPGAA